MLAITRSQAKELRSFLRATVLDQSPKSEWPLLHVSGNKHGALVQTRKGDAAVRWRAAGDACSGELIVRSTLLEEIEGTGNVPVLLEATGPGEGKASWNNGRVPRSVRFATEAPDRLSRIPHFPEPDRPQPGLLATLCDAAQTTNKDGPRVALSRIQLSGGEGRIVATDSRQLLLQRGFRLPWSEEVLMPCVKLFSRTSLCDGREVSLGKSKDHVFLQSDRWDLALMIDATSSYPHVRCVLPREGSEQARLMLHADDASFLAAALPARTSTHGDPSLVTLDPESPPVARMRASADGDVTEIELSRSRVAGSPMQVSLGAQYLQRILSLGFCELRFTGADRAVWCEDKSRTYLCMPISDAVIKSPPGTVRITTVTNEPVHANAIERRTTMTTSDRNGHDSEPNGSQSLDDLIGQAEELRTHLQDAGSRLAKLITALKQQRKQSRVLRQAVAWIKDLDLGA